MTRTPHRPRRLAARIAFAFAVAAGSLAASTSIHAESSHQPAITAARADGAFLRIEGFEFGAAGPPGKDGATGLATIQSLAGLPCTVAACPGTTTVSFDPRTSGLRLSCERAPGSLTFRIEGALSAATKVRTGSGFGFSSDIAGFEGDFAILNGFTPIAFSESVGGLCMGQRVEVTVTRVGGDSQSPLVLQGG